MIDDDLSAANRLLGHIGTSWHFRFESGQVSIAEDDNEGKPLPARPATLYEADLFRALVRAARWTTRDQFAGMAMQGMLGNWKYLKHADASAIEQKGSLEQVVAAGARSYADHLVAELEKPRP